MEEVLNEMHYDGTQLSKFLNKNLLFDKSGRSITQTVMEGSCSLTNGRFKFSGHGAHAIMIAGGVFAFSRNKDLKAIGVFIWLMLGLTYLAGRKK
jgi:hypothetical protein